MVRVRGGERLIFRKEGENWRPSALWNPGNGTALNEPSHTQVRENKAREKKKKKKAKLGHSSAAKTYKGGSSTVLLESHTYFRKRDRHVHISSQKIGSRGEERAVQEKPYEEKKTQKKSGVFMRKKHHNKLNII